VILNVHNGGHWVLATSYQGDTIYVNDPGYSTTYYTLAQIVNGNTGVYTLNRMPKFLTSWLLSIEEFVYSIMGKQKEHQYPPVATFHELNNIRQE
jgi:ABC-type bacteriocin/lantibiotic exporter with double-glycine peptidase domain